MCFGNSGPARRQQRFARQQSLDTRRREQQRQRNIAAGRRSINGAFGSFSDAYFNRYARDYRNHYLPQLDSQYKQAAGTLDARLGDRGIDESTVGLSQQQDLSKRHLDERTNIANASVDAANTLKGNVERAKTDLYSLNEASADPKGINARAVGEATSLVAPRKYSPLGNVFASAIEPWTYYAHSAQNMPGPRPKPVSELASGRGSGRVVQ